MCLHSWDQTLDFSGVCVLAGGWGLHAVLFILSAHWFTLCLWAPGLSLPVS